MSRFIKKTVRALLTSFVPRQVMVWKGRTDQSRIALTFDDGPHPRVTPMLLELLRKYPAKATFFVIGQNVEKYPQLAQEILREGHEIGNHSFTHNGFQKTVLQNAQDEIRRTQEIVFDTTGVRPLFFRSPYGIWSMGILNICLREGLTLAQWSCDIEEGTVQDTLHDKLQTIGSGEIVLMHDDDENTLAAVSQLIPNQTAQGRLCVTLRTLLGMSYTGRHTS